MEKPNHLTDGQWSILVRARKAAEELALISTKIDRHYDSGGDPDDYYVSKLKGEEARADGRWRELTDSPEYAQAVLADTCSHERT